MVDANQVLLIVVVVVLSVLLSFIGIQVFFILREVQRSIQKMNKILDDAGLISGSVAKPVAALTGSLGSASGLAGMLSWLFNRKKKEGKESE